MAHQFKISVEGRSKVTILSMDGEPLARFYVGRSDQELLDLIERRLNRPDPTPRPVLSFTPGSVS